ncbi:MAG TPA: DUF6093 family protein [Propionibacteriaceae bacterium]
MSSVVDITITRGTTTTTTTYGWVAPAFPTDAGEQPARAYLENATQDLLHTGDALTASGVTYAVEAVGWWPPDSIEAVLAGTDLPDTCTIDRETVSAFDPATNIVTNTWAVIWSGPCDIQIGAGGTTSVVVDNAGDPTVIVRGLAKIPASVTDVELGDRLTVTTSRDARLVGVHLAVTAVQMDTTPALRVLMVSDAR